MAYSSSPSDILGDYAHLRTLPAMMSIIFAIASLYQFGGIATVHLEWISYTLTAQHAMMTSLATFVLAFASSETKSFDYYEQWEQGLIASGPIIIFAHQYIPEVTDFVANNSPIAGMMAFMLTVASWGVAVR